MHDLIIRYLSDTYKITLDSYTHFKLFDKLSNEEVSLSSVNSEVNNLYGVEEDEFQEIWELWINIEIIRFENKIADMQYEIYEKTGVELDLNEPKWDNEFNEQILEKLDTLPEAMRDEIDESLMDYVKRNTTNTYRSWNS